MESGGGGDGHGVMGYVFGEVGIEFGGIRYVFCCERGVKSILSNPGFI